MKEIELFNSNEKLIIDDEDFDHLNKFIWKANKCKHTIYAYRNASRIERVKLKYPNRIQVHKVIMNISPLENIIIDHKDRNGLNNQKDNLRKCTNSQNNVNKIYKNNNSRFRGVYPDGKLFRSQICINKIVYKLGKFESDIEAAIAYNTKALELHGEFAILNKI